MINNKLYNFLWYENIAETYDITNEKIYLSNKNPNPNNSVCTIAFKKSKVKKSKVKSRNPKSKNLKKINEINLNEINFLIIIY